jgi:Glycosyl transferase family 2
MRLVMTLLVRNEADIVDAQIAFHLHFGVDFVVATDNGSQDGTTEILERYERAGVLHLIREEGDDMRQDEWVTRMARLAATEFEADWVINSDADEFWWPRGETLKDVLGSVPERFGVIRGCWRHFLPRPDDGTFFAERMTIRLVAPAAPGDMRTVFHAHQKVAHRAHARVVVERGNHNAEAPGLEPLRGWHPVEVLHFSIRSPEQVRRKGLGGWVRAPGYLPAEHQLRLDAALRSERVDAFYEEFQVADETVAAGLTDGTLARDVRVRDALRSLRAEDGTFVLPTEGRAPVFLPPSLPEQAGFAAEASMLVEVDGIVRAEERVNALEQRLVALERVKGGQVLEALRVRRRLARR